MQEFRPAPEKLMFLHLLTFLMGLVVAFELENIQGDKPQQELLIDIDITNVLACSE